MAISNKIKDYLEKSLMEIKYQISMRKVDIIGEKMRKN